MARVVGISDSSSMFSNCRRDLVAALALPYQRAVNTRGKMRIKLSDSQDSTFVLLSQQTSICILYYLYSYVVFKNTYILVCGCRYNSNFCQQHSVPLPKPTVEAKTTIITNRFRVNGIEKGPKCCRHYCGCHRK